MDTHKHIHSIHQPSLHNIFIVCISHRFMNAYINIYKNPSIPYKCVQNTIIRRRMRQFSPDAAVKDLKKWNQSEVVCRWAPWTHIFSVLSRIPWIRIVEIVSWWILSVIFSWCVPWIHIFSMINRIHNRILWIRVFEMVSWGRLCIHVFNMFNMINRIPWIHIYEYIYIFIFIYEYYVYMYLIYTYMNTMNTCIQYIQ